MRAVAAMTDSVGIIRFFLMPGINKPGRGGCVVNAVSPRRVPKGPLWPQAALTVFGTLPRVSAQLTPNCEGKGGRRGEGGRGKAALNNRGLHRPAGGGREMGRGKGWEERAQG